MTPLVLTPFLPFRTPSAALPCRRSGPRTRTPSRGFDRNPNTATENNTNTDTNTYTNTNNGTNTNTDNELIKIIIIILPPTASDPSPPCDSAASAPSPSVVSKSDPDRVCVCSFKSTIRDHLLNASPSPSHVPPPSDQVPTSSDRLALVRPSWRQGIKLYIIVYIYIYISICS